MKKLAIITFILGVFCKAAFCASNPTMDFNARLKVEGIGYKPTSDWEFDKNSKTFTPILKSTATSDTNIGIGQTVFFDYAYRPNKKWYIFWSGEVIGNYADRLHLGITEEKRLSDSGNRFHWNAGVLSYNGGNKGFEFFRHVGRPGWEFSGDMFNLYPAQWEIEETLRVGGSIAPTGGKLWYKTPGLGNFAVITGPELTWGAGPMFLLEYEKPGRMITTKIFIKEEAVSWGETTADVADFPAGKGTLEESMWQWNNYEHKRSIEFVINSRLSRSFPMQVGILYQPFRIGETYEYVEEVGEGAGYLGSKYNILEDETKSSDALAGKISVNSKIFPYFNHVFFNATHAGLLAGNKNELSVELYKYPLPKMVFIGKFTYTKPLIGPLPYLHEGTVENPGQVITTPRGPESPFWVTEDSIGSEKNREAMIFDLFVHFDDTPGTNIYKYNYYELGDWNINPEEDARMAFLFNYRLSKYPTGIDLQRYIDENGQLVWEPATESSMWPTKNFIHSLDLLTVLNPWENWKFIFHIHESIAYATANIAYLNNAVPNTWPATSLEPITNPFKFGVTAEVKKFVGKFEYGKNVWGPEDWHYRFGLTIDEFYHGKIGFRFGEPRIGTMLSLDYIAYHETDKEFAALGSFDEVRLTWDLYFGKTVEFARAASADFPDEEIVLKDIQPPKISLKMINLTINKDFTPAENFNAKLSATDDNKINRWNMKVKDANSNVVFQDTGAGDPPIIWKWDGKIDAQRGYAADGRYFLEFMVYDDFSNKSVVRSPYIYVLSGRNSSVPKHELEKKLGPEFKITDGPDMIKITVQSNVIFKSGGSDFKREALDLMDSLSDSLARYSGKEIFVGVHTDSRGSRSLKSRISKSRARSFANYLGKTIDVSESKGYADSKPVADNSTAKGRALNRRVEITILK